MIIGIFKSFKRKNFASFKLKTSPNSSSISSSVLSNRKQKQKRSPYEPSWLIDGDYFNPLSENFLISLTITHRAQWVGASEKGTAREGKSHLLFIPRLCDELRFICRIVIIWTFFFLSCSFHSVNFNFNYLLVICIVPGSESRSDVYFSFFFFWWRHFRP